MISALVLALAAAATPAPTLPPAVSADGTRIAYDVAGRGEPTVVLVHCWTCDRHFWDAQWEALAARQRVVRLDLAGHGDSASTRQAWTIEAFGDDVVAVADALKLERVVLVGHSMGGHVSLAAARKLKGRVVGIVPVDTLLDFEERMPPEQIEAFGAQLEKDYAGTAEMFTRQYLFVPASPPKVVEDIVARVKRAPRAMATAALRSTWAYDVAGAVDALDVPFHAVNGDKFPTNVERNRRHAKRFDVTLLPGVGHYPMLEAPARFLPLLEGAIGAVSKAPAAR